jgi:hypothetical protein
MNGERSERVVEAVLARIAGAPGVERRPAPAVDLRAWAIPALAAAAVVMALSLASLSQGEPVTPPTVWDAVGVRSGTPLARFVSTGEVDAGRWLFAPEGRP